MRGKVIIVQHGQCIFDIAAQYYGSKDGVTMVLEDNPTLPGLDTRLTAGQKLQIKQAPINQAIVDYYKKHLIVPVTEVDDIDSFFTNIQLVQDGDFQLLQDGSYQLLQ